MWRRLADEEVNALGMEICVHFLKGKHPVDARMALQAASKLYEEFLSPGAVPASGPWQTQPVAFPETGLGLPSEDDPVVVPLRR